MAKQLKSGNIFNEMLERGQPLMIWHDKKKSDIR